MIQDESSNLKWRYFGRDAMTGKIIEIYRCPDNGKRVEKQKLEDVHLLLPDGSWQSNMREVLVDDISKGEFNEKSDEISEEEAMNIYRTWLAGEWPGRK